MDEPIADAYGAGERIDQHGNRSEISASSWTELFDVDKVQAIRGVVMIRYRSSGREVQVPDGDTYDVLVGQDGDIDVFTGQKYVDLFVDRLQGMTLDWQGEDDVINACTALENKADLWGVRHEFQQRTGKALDQALRDELSADALRTIDFFFSS